MHWHGLRESVPPGPNPWPTSGSGLHFPVQERGVVEAVRLHNSTSEMLASLPCSARCRDSVKEDFAKATRHCFFRNARYPHPLFQMGGHKKKKETNFLLNSLPYLLTNEFLWHLLFFAPLFCSHTAASEPNLWALKYATSSVSMHCAHCVWAGIGWAGLRRP